MKKSIEMDVESNKKFQATMKRIERFKALSSEIKSSNPTTKFLQGIQTSASKLMAEASVASRKIDSLVEKAEARKRHTNKKTSKLGGYIGKIGQIAGRQTPEEAAKVLDDGATPIVKQILETAKGVIDAIDKAGKDAIGGMARVKQTSIDGARRLNEQAKSIVIERTTSMMSKIQTFAKETYGGFMSQDDIDKATKDSMDALLAKTQSALELIDKQIPDETKDPDDETKNSEYIEGLDESIEQMRGQYTQSKTQAIDSAIIQAKYLVGEELAREIAIDVFGLEEATASFSRIPQTRGVVSGAIGMAKSVITGGG